MSQRQPSATVHPGFAAPLPARSTKKLPWGSVEQYFGGVYFDFVFCLLCAPLSSHE